MKTSTPFKIFTIFLFILLIAVFVSYRSGVFSNGNIISAKEVDTNGIGVNKMMDTVPAAFRDSVLRVYTKISMMSGSKSAPVIPDANHPAIREMIDSLWKQRVRQRMDSSKPGKLIMQ